MKPSYRIVSRKTLISYRYRIESKISLSLFIGGHQVGNPVECHPVPRFIKLNRHPHPDQKSLCPVSWSHGRRRKEKRKSPDCAELGLPTLRSLGSQLGRVLFTKKEWSSSEYLSILSIIKRALSLPSENFKLLPAQNADHFNSCPLVEALL